MFRMINIHHQLQIQDQELFSKVKNLFSAIKMPFLSYHNPVLFINFLAQAVAPVMSARHNRHLVTRVHEHLTSDKNSHNFQHIYGSETCRALYSEHCFLILDAASTSFQLKIKEHGPRSKFSSGGLKTNGVKEFNFFWRGVGGMLVDFYSISLK